MRWPWISVRILDELERQLSYRDAVIDKIQLERDNYRDMYQRSNDLLLAGVGAPPVSPPVRADIEAAQAEQKKLDNAYAQLMQGVDAETTYCEQAEIEESPVN